MPTQFVFSASTFGKWKQEARAIKRATQISHNEALEQVAAAKGFESWHHLTHEAKLNSVTETALRRGLIVAYSLRDAMDSFDPGDIFLEDWRALSFCKDEIVAWYATNNDERDDDYVPIVTLGSYDVPEEPDDWSDDVCLFRYCGPTIPATPREALPIFDAQCFFAPLFFWHKGQFIDPWRDLAVNRVLDMSGQ